MRSGLIKAKNDDLIRELIADPKYDVREDGTVWSLRSGQWSLVGRRDKEGYVEVYYKGKRLKAHRVVYAKFSGRLAEDLVVDHGDATPWNNHPRNLRLCGQQKNVEYANRRKERMKNGKSRQAA